MGLLEAANVLSPALVNELIGLGTWRLKGQLDPAIAFLAQRIEGTWREAFLDGGCACGASCAHEAHERGGGRPRGSTRVPDQC